MILFICVMFVWDVMWLFIKACLIILWNLTIWPLRLIYELVKS